MLHSVCVGGGGILEIKCHDTLSYGMHPSHESDFGLPPQDKGKDGPAAKDKAKKAKKGDAWKHSQVRSGGGIAASG